MKKDIHSPKHLPHGKHKYASITEECFNPKDSLVQHFKTHNPNLSYSMNTLISREHKGNVKISIKRAAFSSPPTPNPVMDLTT